jgi:hypothetical protein
MTELQTITATFSAAPDVTLITHYYVSILGREPDNAGLTYWHHRVLEKQQQGQDVKSVFRDMAHFFFNSSEYLGQAVSDARFITDLYWTFFQRAPDYHGMQFWLGQLASGVSRDDVMADFLYSSEFTAFMEGLGL